MNTLNDKTARRALIDKYLEAETSPAEERQLREWFATHSADEDEADLALLIGLAAPCASCLPEVEREEEFDALVAPSASRPKLHLWRKWALGIAAAAAVVTLVLVLLKPAEKPLSPVVIAENIRQLMDLSPDQIESVTAKPEGAHAILTVHLKDGSTCAYLLTSDEEAGTTSLVAYEPKSKR
ncbi:MAG: hypothetical protein J5702_05000 [Bacteroidales bacterium]|nr:hypothetical protein [Bacteroidales bacterium]